MLELPSYTFNAFALFSISLSVRLLNIWLTYFFYFNFINILYRIILGELLQILIEDYLYRKTNPISPYVS